MKFRKKPVVITAEQWWPGTAVAGVAVQAPMHAPDRQGGEAFPVPERHYVVTIHGQRAYLAPGDWVIPEPDGEHHYPCKPDIFAQTYERVEE